MNEKISKKLFENIFLLISLFKKELLLVGKSVFFHCYKSAIEIWHFRGYSSLKKIVIKDIYVYSSLYNAINLVSKHHWSAKDVKALQTLSTCTKDNHFLIYQLTCTLFLLKKSFKLVLVTLTLKRKNTYIDTKFLNKQRGKLSFN